MNRLFRIAIALLLTVLLFSACTPAADTPAGQSAEPSPAGASSAPPTPEPTPAVPFDTPDVGTFALGVLSPFTSGDPHQGDTELTLGIAEGLVRLRNGAYAPGVAESYVTDDYKTWTFTLRADAAWSDGMALTAEDFVYSWELAKERAASVDALKAVPVLSGLEVKADDPLTLTATLAEPCPWFLQYAASAALAPVHQALYEANPDAYGKTPEATGCNGPFVLKSMQNDKTVLTKNDAYWDKASVSAGEVWLQTGKDEAELIAGLEGGNLHAARVAGAELAGGASALTFPGSAVDCLLINRLRMDTNQEMVNEEISGILTNANFHMALTYSIDREALATATDGRFAPAEFLTSGAINVNNAAKQTYAELRASQIMTVRMNRAADTKKASDYFAAFLADLHYADAASIPQLPLAAADDADTKAIVALMAKQVQDTIGIKLLPEYVSVEQLRARAESGDYDLMVYPVEAAYNDPMATLSLFGAEDAFKNSWQLTDSSGFGYYTSTLEASAPEPDADVRALQLLQAEGFALMHAPMLPLFIPQNRLLVSDENMEISLTWKGLCDYTCVNVGK